MQVWLPARQLLITSLSLFGSGLLFVADLEAKRALIFSDAPALRAQRPQAFSASDDQITFNGGAAANGEHLVCDAAFDDGAGSDNQLAANSSARKRALDVQAGASHITFNLAAGTDVDAAGLDGAAGAALNVQNTIRNDVASERETLADHGGFVRVQNSNSGVAPLGIERLIVDSNHGCCAFCCRRFWLVNIWFFEHG